MKNVLFYCLIFLFCSGFVLNNSNSFSDLIKGKLTTYANENWPEKVYIHTDKPYYTLDEDLWFSTYLVNGISHTKSSKSAVVYVDLINEADSIVKTKRLFIDDLSSGGFIKINKNWLPGKYLIRAYTNYMRNENPEIFFQKEIKIVSLDPEMINAKIDGITERKEKSLSLIKPELHFFPEGGYLVDNMSAKVAFKIKNSQYYNFRIPIEIVDSRGYQLSKTTSTEFGLGFFYINPKPNEDYYANLYLNDQVYQYKLPKTLSKGYGLNINFKEDKLLIRLSSNKEIGLKNSYLMVHQRGNVLFDEVVTTTKTSKVTTILTSTLQDGIAHITLFNDEGQPVCERLVYIDNPKNNAVVTIGKNKEDLQPREKLTLDFKLKDISGNNLTGNLSLSVRDIEAIPETNNAPNIKTWLLLNSDLRGKIDNPGYFFTKGESSKKKYLLDLVMMTNGWRRFTWPGILEHQGNSSSFEIEKGIHIRGATKKLESPNTPVKAANTITFLGKQTLEIQNTNSDKNGKFSFGPYVFYDSIPTLLESRLIDPTIKTNEDLRKVLISIEKKTTSSPEIKRPKTRFSSNPIALNDDFIEAANYKKVLNRKYDEDRELLDEVLLTATKKSKEEERQEEMEGRSFFGSPTSRLDMEADEFLSKTELKYIFQRFPGVRVGPLNLYYRGEPSRILFNNRDVTLDFVNSLNPADISFIDFYNPNNSVYNRAPGGVFIIYGKLGVDANIKSYSKLPGIISFTARGFDSSKEFYAPDYSKDINQMTRTDVRTTLHWEPQIRLSAQNPLAEVSFYSCDLKSTYLIEIEGITDSGIPVHEISYFSVN